MRVHAARDLDATAWSQPGDPHRVQFRVGVTRYSATPAEARELARQLISAADTVEEGSDRGADQHG